MINGDLMIWYGGFQLVMGVPQNCRFKGKYHLEMDDDWE